MVIYYTFIMTNILGSDRIFLVVAGFGRLRADFAILVQDGRWREGSRREVVPMISLLVSFLLYALAFMLTARIVPGIEVRSYRSAVGFAIVFAILDGLLFKVLAVVTMPLVVLSLGLFLLVIRAGLFLLTDKFIDGVKIDGFLSALLGSVVTGVLNSGITWLVHKIF